MKEDWAYIPFAEVCESMTKGPFGSDIKKSLYVPKSVDTYKVYIQANAIEKDASIGEYYISKEYFDTKMFRFEVKPNDYIITCDGTLGKYLRLPLTIERGIISASLLRITLNQRIVPKYFEYLWDGFIMGRLTSDIRNSALVHLPSADKIGKVKIPLPSLSEQERIVAELDLLSGIIDKQNAQLKELDTLAQSIFYDMFGDPVENDKDWEVKKLLSVSTLLNGRAYQQNELLPQGKYKVLRVGNFFTNGNYYYSDLELDDDKYCYRGDLLFAWSASFGAFIWDEGKTIYHYHIWRVLFDKAVLDIQYYRFLLNTMTSYFMKDVHGIGMVHLTKAGMEQYDLPIPPLYLQKSFAEKIQAIDNQKEAINKAIKETQTLFDYTMDKYFG